jgi:hypothetical protein
VPAAKTVALLLVVDCPPMKLDTPTKPSQPTKESTEELPFSTKPCKTTKPLRGKYTWRKGLPETCRDSPKGSSTVVNKGIKRAHSASGKQAKSWLLDRLV